MSASTHDPSQAPGLADNALEEARSLIGVPLRRQDHYWNTEASPDAVRHFCWGIGDENPLFCDPKYGETTRWKTGLAPGCFLFTIDSTVVAPKLRGIQWIYSGVDWQWYKPIRHRDRFTTKVQLIDAVEKTGAKANRFIVQTGESLYHNQDGELVCRANGSTARIPRARAKGGLKYQPRETHRYSEEELRDIAAAIEAEEIRGSTPRFWEDVNVGDVAKPVVKGPLNITDMICWYSGGGHTYQAHERAHRYRKRHPADAYRDPKTGAQDSAARGHAEKQMAREVGMPGGYDVGTQRVSWLGHLMTNWVGDDGFVRRLYVEVRRPNIFGDVSWCRGTVVDKRIEDGMHLVELAVRIENQLGDITADGTSIVELPSRKHTKG
jgi:acyl dehydratase